MEFGIAQKKVFGTTKGAYSIVTRREDEDSQITLTDYEVELAVKHFGNKNIYVGSVKLSGKMAEKEFSLFPSGKKIKLNLIYPKPNKSELRLYLSKRAGFKPKGGEVWFLFIKKGKLWIGAMQETEWRSSNSELKRDDFDYDYQTALDEYDSVRIATLKKRDVYTRDRNIALKVMKKSGYKCEFNSKHNLFISRFSRNPYLEAHHLIPISLQKLFKKPLDTVQNVFCLCSRCHRVIHHGDEPLARKIIETLSSRRPIDKIYSINIDDLYNYYAVEKIT